MKRFSHIFFELHLIFFILFISDFKIFSHDENIQFVVGRRGNYTLMYNGNAYHKHHVTKKGLRISWRCLKRHSGCRAHVYTNDGFLDYEKSIENDKLHNHPPAFIVPKFFDGEDFKYDFQMKNQF